MFLDYFALFLVFFVSLVIFYGIIVLHDIPYEIAVKRNHPHQDAIHYAGWVSLFTLHAIWPFLWIWAALYKEGVGWGMTGAGGASNGSDNLANEVAALRKEVESLKAQLSDKE